MMQTLGLLFIVVGGGGLILVGLCALAPGLFSMRPKSGAIRIEPKNLISPAGFTPQSGAAGQNRVRLARPVPSVTDELFSELFALRAEVAALTEDVRSMRQELEAASSQDDVSVEATQTAA